MLMTTITLDHLQQNLPGYIHRARAGESLLIIEDGRPIAEFKPATPQPRQLRPFGLCAGEFTLPADFDAALPEEILAEFDGACNY